jgi:hypothetical protein
MLLGYDTAGVLILLAVDFEEATCPMLSYYLRSSSFVTLFSDKFKSEVSFFLSLIYCIIFLDFCRFLKNMEV